MDEMARLKKQLNPREILFIAAAMTGQVLYVDCGYSVMAI